MRLGRPLPTAVEVGELLEVLLGRSVKTAKPKTSRQGAPERGAVAAYRGAAGTEALCHVDLPLAVLAGAALSVIPPAQARQQVEAGQLEGVLLENLREVMNVSARFFNRSGGRHVRLEAVHVCPAALPDDVKSLIARPAERLDVDVEIDGYGGGTLALLVR